MKISRMIRRMAVVTQGCAALSAFGASIPAFPGAEGYGAYSTGGRGGDVYIVTNLGPSGEGSFANGIATVPPRGRTIVFAVSGYIPISKLKLAASNVTIAGQTAPGEGVSLKGSIFWISGGDVVVRFMRFRHGVERDGGDLLETDRGARNLMIDHCDVQFARDENFSMFKSAPPTMTFQWSINAWGLKDHSCGGLWMVDRTTAHHTLWANNHTRNPKVITPQAFDWINNVSFGWDIGMNLAGADVPGTYRVNLRGSTFIPGGKAREAIFGGGVLPDGTVPFQVYVDDCDGTMATMAVHRARAPFPQTAGVPVAIDHRAAAYKKVVSQVGAVRMDIDPGTPLRDAVDALLIDDVVAGRRRMIGDARELRVDDRLRSAPAPLDSDRDGMPDYYETAVGWDPSEPDHNVPLAARNGTVEGLTFLPAGTPAGYTRLEEYLHFLAVPHGVVPRSAAGLPSRVVVDLRKFTCGFTASPVFTVANVTGGTVAQGGAGGAVAAFSPTPGYAGRARFDFTVRDRAGHAWTQTCALVVTTGNREDRP